MKIQEGNSQKIQDGRQGRPQPFSLLQKGVTILGQGKSSIVPEVHTYHAQEVSRRSIVGVSTNLESRLLPWRRLRALRTSSKHWRRLRCPTNWCPLLEILSCNISSS